MKKQLNPRSTQLTSKIMVHQIADNPIYQQYHEINQRLEQKVSEDTAEIVQIAKELAATNTELQIANKELENFARTVSHDLQEPLRSISMFTELLEAEYREELDEQAQEYLGYITGSAVRMQTLIRDLLSYSRAGKNEQTWLNVDLNHLVKTVIIDLQGIIQETKAIIILESLPTTLINPTEISQLFRNLISNSLKFRSEEQPKITIASELCNNQWLITIQDNGIGIEPEYHDAIFGIFKRLHSQQKYSGNGIGLAICQKIIERHQGEIGVSSQLGKGSTFYFTLPQSPVTNQSPSLNLE